MRVVAIIGALVLALAVLAFLNGRSTRDVQDERVRADTFERVQDADLGDGASDGDNADWLRSRGER